MARKSYVYVLDGPGPSSRVRAPARRPLVPLQITPEEMARKRAPFLFTETREARALTEEGRNKIQALLPHSR